MARNKVTNHKVNEDFLVARESRASRFPTAKWILFCRFFLRRGFDVYLYEARQTVSKYVTLKKDGKQYKVRFSDHKPILSREAEGDCDFFVGRTNFKVTTTKDASLAALKHFGVEYVPTKVQSRTS